MTKRSKLLETRKHYIEKLLAKTIIKGIVEENDVVVCSECRRELEHLEEYLVFNNKLVCQKVCMKTRKIKYEGYTDDYLNDLWARFYKIFPTDIMGSYDIVSCQVIPVNYEGKIKYHIDIFFRPKLYGNDDFEVGEDVYKLLKKCPVNNCTHEISKIKLEMVFCSENPEKIRQKEGLIKIIDVYQIKGEKLRDRLKTGIPCCKHYDMVFGDRNENKTNHL